MQYKKYLFLDAGDTLLTLKQPPGQIYFEVIAAHIPVQPESAATINRAFREAWKSMPPGAGGRDRFSTHPEGEMGWWEELITNYQNLLGIFPDEKKQKSIYLDIFSRFDDISVWDFDPGIEILAQTLAGSGTGLGMISNWDSRLKILLEKLDLAKYFQPLVISAEAGYEKPSLKIFQIAAGLVGLESGLIYAGDKPELDYYPPLELGWDAYLVGKMNQKSGINVVKNLTGLAERLKVKLQ